MLKIYGWRKYNHSIERTVKIMEDLIKALQILLKYGNPKHPTYYEHDILIICGIDPSDVSEEDKKQLEELGFSVGLEFGEPAFQSFRFGNC